MCISKDGDGVGTRDDVASSEATASEASASEVGGATAAKQPEQGGSEAANEEEEDVWRRRSLQASGNASQAEGVESSNEARRVAESAQVATATDADTGTFLFLVYLVE